MAFEEFTFVLPGHLTAEARSRLAAARAFEREALALLGALLGCEPPPLHPCEERPVHDPYAPRVLRIWSIAGAGLRAVAVPIESSSAAWGEEIEFECFGLEPPTTVRGFASLDVRVGGSIRLAIAGCPPDRIDAARRAFGRVLAELLGEPVS
ncbi:hypothetical protein [Tepidiforma sp.]|uniref:hypothetical protein n=1 Tax=Tepidiforma sp. TaxID=2682230 RepID=UPI002ADDC16B|nr:hypothetical protein [Tepidiforma sp.]